MLSIRRLSFQVFNSLIHGGVFCCNCETFLSFCFSLQWECAWFSILTTSFLLLLCWAYFWLVAQNDFNEFNWWVCCLVVLYRFWVEGGPTLLVKSFFCKSKRESQGHVSLSTSGTDSISPLQAGVQSLWGMEGWDGSPPCIHHCGIHLRYILDGEGLSLMSPVSCDRLLVWPLTKSSFSFFPRS